MTDERMTFWLDYICDIARRMKLNDWHFRLTDEPCEGDAHAKITPTEGRCRALIQVAYDFERSDPEEQRHVIVHELIHAHLEPAEQVLRGGAGVLDDTVFNCAVLIHRDMLEYAIDQLAAVIAESMPLPGYADARDAA